MRVGLVVRGGRVERLTSGDVTLSPVVEIAARGPRVVQRHGRRSGCNVDCRGEALPPECRGPPGLEDAELHDVPPGR